jgi:hypothetical protein
VRGRITVIGIMKGEKMERERENGETEWAHSSNERDREWRERMER